MWRDLKFAVRSLKAPGFALIAILTLVLSLVTRAGLRPSGLGLLIDLVGASCVMQLLLGNLPQISARTLPGGNLST